MPDDSLSDEDERAVQLMVRRIVGKGPREIIARAVGGGPAYYSLADLILDRLRAAGYQIVKTYEASQNEMMDEEVRK